MALESRFDHRVEIRDIAVPLTAPLALPLRTAG
jgi:hypothetical protein